MLCDQRRWGSGSRTLLKRGTVDPLTLPATEHAYPAILNLKVLWVKKLYGRKKSGAGGMKTLHFGPVLGTRDAKTAIFTIAGAHRWRL